MNLGNWGPAEWIAVLGVFAAAASWATRVLVVLSNIAQLLVELKIWLEVLGEEYPDLRERVAAKRRARPRLSKLHQENHGLSSDGFSASA